MNKNIKLFGMALLAGVAMTSCSNEDDVTNWDDTYLSRKGIISFVSSLQTRTTTTASFNNFYATIRDNTSNSVLLTREKFSYDGEVGAYKSETDYYWPAAGTIDIYAVAGDSNADNLSTPTTATQKCTYKYINDTFTRDIQVSSALSAEQQSPYPLTFKHILSKVKIKIAATETYALNYQLTSIQMTTPKTGTYTFPSSESSTGSWSIANDTQDRTFWSVYYAGSAASSFPYTMSFTQSVWTDWSYILPTKTEPITFDVEYKVYNGAQLVGDYTGTNKKTVTVATPDLEMGREYTFILSIPSGSARMTFSLSEEDWASNIKTVNGYKFVDMGLPSGTLWAAYYVGATSEAERGNNYAWGETQEQSPKTYSASTYKYTESVSTDSQGNEVCTYSKYNTTDGKTTLEASDDAATANWGSPCRMPTAAECQELIDNCTAKPATRILSGETVYGVELISKTNGESLFFRGNLTIFQGEPLIPEEYDGKISYIYICGNSLGEGEEGTFGPFALALGCEYESGDIFVDALYGMYRYAGLPVRPVASRQ